jgi:two-component system, NtrC family, sensor kinase
VAMRWRIRHKLLLGLGLVVGIIALLLVGTIQGLTAFLAAAKTSDSKLAELRKAEDLKIAIDELNKPSDAGLTLDEEEVRLKRKLTQAEDALAEYVKQLEDTLARKRDPKKGEHEQALVGDLRLAFEQGHQAITHFREQPYALHEGEARRLGDDAGIRTSAARLTQLGGELRHAIYDDLYYCIERAKSHQRHSLITVIATSILGVVLMAALLRFFYGWVFHPIRDLQAGVGRVAAGDFEHRIELHSGDELEELAGAFNDMTGRLQAMYTDLARQVNERSRQLVRSERLASVGFLAAGVAHEINNPLQSIAFCSDALERRLTDLLGRFPREHEAVNKYLKMIQQEAFRCKSITQNLLEFSRVGEGQRQPTDLAKVVQSVLDMVQHLRNCQGKQIVFRPSGQPVALANPQEIYQVVLNLVVNALDSMDDGGVLTIALGESDKGVELVFADTGCGMPPEVLENIFEPFFTRSRTGKGTGLGLSISHRIIGQHGGEIEATSPGTGQGSTFVVRLPLAPAATQPKEETLGRAAA